jgi:hypothetical protein
VAFKEESIGQKLGQNITPDDWLILWNLANIPKHHHLTEKKRRAQRFGGREREREQ